MNSEDLYFEREKLLFDLALLENPNINFHVGYGLRDRHNSARLNISDDEEFNKKLKEFVVKYVENKLTEL